jgi:hypothetical protein
MGWWLSEDEAAVVALHQHFVLLHGIPPVEAVERCRLQVKTFERTNGRKMDLHPFLLQYLSDVPEEYN